MSSLQVTIAGIKLKNPTMLASGIMDETGASMVKAARAGAGAVVTKSIGLEARPGYPNPTLVEMEYGYLNAMGLPGPGIDEFGEEMSEAKGSGVPIIGSIFAATPQDFAALAIKMQSYGAAAVELNLSCPHAKGYGMEIGIDPEAVRAIVSEVKRSIAIPVLSKLTPNTHRLVEVGRAVQEAGGDAIVAINTVKAMAISTEFRRPILFNRTGGLSGPAIKPIGVRCVYELYSALDVPIIGAGGIENCQDALEYMMAGASVIQIGSGVGRVGMSVFSKISTDLGQWLDDHHLESITEIVGVAHDI